MLFVVVTAVLTGCAGSTPPRLASATDAVISSAAPSVALPSRTATPSAPPVLHYLAVGDSIPFGGADCGCDGFPQRYGDWIGQVTNRTVDTRNFSQHDNNTAARMAVELAGHGDVVAAISEADVITVTIGHNDTPWNASDDACDGNRDIGPKTDWLTYTGPCLTTEVARYRRNLGSILDQILAWRAGKATAIRFTEQYNDIPGDPCCSPAAATASAKVKDAFNKAACEVVEAHRAVCIDVYHAFNGADGSSDPGDLLAPDHTHPSSTGHQRITGLLIAAGLSPIR